VWEHHREKWLMCRESVDSCCLDEDQRARAGARVAQTRHHHIALARLSVADRNLADEVLGPLGTTPRVTLRVTIEIEATAPEGFDDAKARTVSENAATLKFEQSGFEEG
jgi:hypothetical protein